MGNRDIVAQYCDLHSEWREIIVHYDCNLHAAIVSAIYYGTGLFSHQ
jgi:hypothetical protein